MASVAKKYSVTDLCRWDSAALVDATCVLMASESHAFCRQLAERLQHSGYQVVQSRSGLDVLDRVGPRSRNPRSKEPVDLLVLDISDNPWVGLALLEAVRGQDWALPVVLITGETNDTIRSEAGRLGVHEMLKKPVDPERVAEVVMEIEPPMEELDWCA